ncbi:surface carbohydrate biosynthesis protein [Azospirillum thermophilum]|uniref:Surface carbohydrate biosynthesis protein n=1 Tax=Azospirillum thermophilum TaxID=2202148 RepID=A0A2S2D0H3_9PROT|nr:surface carbohydrate biosynthesis protein [Azospirillum thermophilum]AWK90254.1 hypothetical protein DEW08_30045 [Azospirillum thermophilum]
MIRQSAGQAHQISALPKDERIVVLIVDHPRRDLAGLVLVARALCASGRACALMPANLRFWELPAVLDRVDFVLLQNAVQGNEDMMALLAREGIPYGVLQSEGSVYFEEPGPDDAPMTRNDTLDGLILENAALRDRVAVFCAWTEWVADYLVHFGYFRPDQVAVTGTPRTDLLVAPLAGASRSLSASAGRYGRPLVMVNCTFTIANPRFVTPEQEISYAVRDSNGKFTRPFLEAYQHSARDALQGTVALTNDLAQRFPDVAFLVRPHPFESLDIYRETLLPLPNLHLDGSGSIEGWLLRADAVIHWCSSTAIEAAVVGIPALQPQWLPQIRRVPFADAASVACDTLEDLARHLEAIVAGRFTLSGEERARIDATVRRAFHMADGQAHRRVARAVLAALDRTGGRTGEAAGPPRDLPAVPQASLERWQASDKRFDAHDVHAILAAVDGASGAAAASPATALPVPGTQAGIFDPHFPAPQSVVLIPAAAACRAIPQDAS